MTINTISQPATSAPWKIWHSGYANAPFVIYFGTRKPSLNQSGQLILNGSLKIAEVYHDESEQHDEQKANANLIASAPELLDCLKRAIEIFWMQPHFKTEEQREKFRNFHKYAPVVKWEAAILNASGT